jgi:O-antigen ligase
MSSLPALCDSVTRWGLVTLVAFTPLAFGTVEPWSIAVMEWGIVTLVLVFWLGRLWPGGRDPGPGRSPLTGMEIPFGLFLLFCVLQTVALPMPVLERVSPGSALMYRQPESSAPTAAAEKGSVVVGAPAPPAAQVRRPVSVNTRETWSRIRLVAVFGALFLLTSWWSERQRVVFLLTSVTIAGFLVAVFGLVQFLTWNGKIYWIRKVPPSSPFGPFVNHNHFAGYVEMIIPVAISLALYLMEVRRARYRGGDAATRAPGSGPGRSEDDRGRWGKGILASFAAVILLVALFFSMSRGGILSTLVSGCIFFVIVWHRIGSRRVAWLLAVALPVLAAVLILWIGPGIGTGRLAAYATREGESSFRLREVVWKRMMEEMPRFLWAGSGLGTFEDGFAPFAPPGTPKRWDKAHNDYLQILWETGVVGGALFLAGIVVFVRRYWWPAFRSRVHPYDILRMGIAVSLLSIALHSLVDFNLQIGSNGFLCALLAGLLAALDRAVGREGPRSSL